jgi:hypothetical protein
MESPILDMRIGQVIREIPIVFKAIEVQTLAWVCRIIAEDGGSK